MKKENFKLKERNSNLKLIVEALGEKLRKKKFKSYLR